MTPAVHLELVPAVAAAQLPQPPPSRSHRRSVPLTPIPS
jgi:hypothetical protein